MEWQPFVFYAPYLPEKIFSSTKIYLLQIENRKDKMHKVGKFHSAVKSTDVSFMLMQILSLQF